MARNNNNRNNNNNGGNNNNNGGNRNVPQRNENGKGQYRPNPYMRLDMRTISLEIERLEKRLENEYSPNQRRAIFFDLRDLGHALIERAKEGLYYNP